MLFSDALVIFGPTEFTYRTMHTAVAAVRRAVELVIEHGGIEYAHKKMLEYKDKALELVRDIPDSDSKQAILGLVEYTTTRKK